ncbi:MAG TPA: alpha/beta fold hydrolase [Accumulibacter sp.]|uniref:PHA/PHB synthase family protein n=3 Tax=Accumulibacter sp. TaxID=2053492 RepID=UPI002B964C2F|nr:alpha/beta fold hydrolase [Accumulibacter sp.]HMV04902.1 alpha/beta fold hydrolase [Accumulibacter sp.]
MADTPNDTTQATATVAADAATDGAPAKRRARPANPGATPRRRKTATAAAGNPAPAVEVAAPPAPPLAATASPADPPPVNAEPAVKPSEAGAPATAGGTSGTHFSRRLGDRHLLDSDALENIDRMTNIALGQLSGGVSPASLAMAYLDWVVHLSASPGKQFQLGAKAARKALRLASYALNSAMTGSAEDCIKPLPGDHRFDHPGWQQFPFNVIYQGFLLNQQWWHNATTGIRGVSKHSEAAVWFIAKQILDMMAPANMPAMNPEIVEATIKERGANLTRGAQHYAEDFRRSLREEKPAGVEAFQVGKNLAVTPGQVVFRNHLIELIQYAPASDTVHREPVLMQSAWMMKYYILDLSPHNSLVRYLVERGHTVFMISWLNPGREHRNLGMEDYRKAGTLAAINAISEILPGRKIHTVGYCLGGILLTITAAAMARDGDDRLASMTLFTTMTDFTDVGEINVFMDASEVTLLEDMMWEKGYLGHKQVSGGFQLLKSADLIWSKMVREYYLGHREPMFDLMAWNADGTRMPYRQHSEVLRRLYVDNQLFQGKYMVGGRAISISNIHCPIFAVAAAADHVAPWRSVYKLHLQSDAAELTFVLTSGGHNVGIINEPGRPHRSFQMSVCHEGERFLDAETWKEKTPRTEGSWWPTWQQWLVKHSTGMEGAPPMGAPEKGLAPLCAAPGTYVFQQ